MKFYSHYYRLNRKTNDNSALELLRGYIGIEDPDFEDIGLFLKNVTDDDIIQDCKNEDHPFLHELVQQYHSSLSLLQYIWNLDKFKNYWDNPHYLDVYGNTVMERLTKIMEGQISSEKVVWIKENITNPSNNNSFFSCSVM